MSMKEIEPGGTEIRVMNEGDLEAITAIDAMYFGVSRPEYYKEKLDAAGMERFTMNNEQFAIQMKNDMEKFGRIIKAAKVKLD